MDISELLYKNIKKLAKMDEFFYVLSESLSLIKEG